VPVRRSRRLLRITAGGGALRDFAAVRQELGSGWRPVRQARGTGDRGRRSISAQQVLACACEAAAVPRRPAESGRCQCQD